MFLWGLQKWHSVVHIASCLYFITKWQFKCLRNYAINSFVTISPLVLCNGTLGHFKHTAVMQDDFILQSSSKSNKSPLTHSGQIMSNGKKYKKQTQCTVKNSNNSNRKVTFRSHWITEWLDGDRKNERFLLHDTAEEIAVGLKQLSVGLLTFLCALSGVVAVIRSAWILRTGGAPLLSFGVGTTGCGAQPGPSPPKPEAQEKTHK